MNLWQLTASRNSIPKIPQVHNPAHTGITTMYKLTPTRIKKALPILEEYRRKLYTDFGFSAYALDSELQKCWNIWYQQLKDIFEDMLKNERYHYVAIYFMEHCNHFECISGVSDFEEPLYKAMGINRNDTRDVKEISREFWGKFKQENLSKR